MAVQPNNDTKSRITVMVSDSVKMELNRIALELSEPGDRVDTSEVVREGIHNYLEKYDLDPSECNPRERGCIGGVEIEVDEGAV